MTLGEKIKAERKRIGLTQEQLADKLCVSRQAIQKWESDNGVPSIENLKAISQLFDISIDSLVSDEEAPLQEEKPNEPSKEEQQEKEEAPRQKMKFCPKCGAEHYEDVKFCKRCGYFLASDNVLPQTPLVGAAQVESVQPQVVQPQSPEKAKLKKKLKIILPIVSCLTAAVIVLCAFIPTFIAMGDKPPKDELDETGIVYVYNKQQHSYAIKSIGGNQDKDFVVPSEFKGKPVTVIKRDAFKDAEFESVTIGGAIDMIELYAFENAKIKNLTIDGMTKIGTSAFENAKIESVAIGENTTAIGYCAFRNCTELKSVTIGENVAKIGAYAFSYCTQLEDVSIESGIQELEEQVFADCKKLSSITYNGTIKEWYSISRDEYGYWNTNTGDFTVLCTDGNTAKSEEGLEYSFELDKETDTYTLTGFHYISVVHDGVIPSRYHGKAVTKIGTVAFYQNNSIGSVTISEGVTSIGTWAFAYSSVQKIVIPKSVTSIGNYVFEGCNQRINITYNGTIEEWRAVQKPSNGKPFSGWYVLTCSDGGTVWDDFND